MTRFQIAAILAIQVAWLSTADALINVGGKDPVPDRNWPAGSLDVANHKSRQSFSIGPPFGGGQYVFQYRGDTAAFNDVLGKFAQLKAPDLLLVIHDGAAENQFASAQEKTAKRNRLDWSFTVWTPESFYQLYGGAGPAFMADQPEFRSELSPPELDVFPAPGGVEWEKVQVPAGLRVVDGRAASHGYLPEDGSVVAGTAYDMISSKPVAAVEVFVARYERKSASDDAGGVARNPKYVWTKVASAVGDADGRFELKHIPVGSYQVMSRCVGYAPRMIGHFTANGATFASYTTRLSPAVEQKGTVTDPAGKPLANVKVRVDTMIAIDGGGYAGRTNEHQEVVTDPEGRFILSHLPRGEVWVTAWAEGLHQIDPLAKYPVPADALNLHMARTGSIHGTVAGKDGNPLADGDVSIWPEGGERVGTWGAGGRSDADGTFHFENVPPGKYYASADPAAKFDAGRSKKLFEVKPGETVEVELKK